MGKSFINVLILLSLLHQVNTAYAFTFYDNFDSPSFTNSNWLQPGPPAWDFVAVNGSDLGYHNATGRVGHDDSRPEGISIANNGSVFSNAGLIITSTFRLGKSMVTNWHQAGIFFGFDDSDPKQVMGYSVGLEIDQEGSSHEFQLELDALGGEIIPGKDHPREVNVPITWGTFYTVKIVVGSDQKMNAYLYNDQSILLGSILDVSPVLPVTAGKVGVKTGSEVTFKSFEVKHDIGPSTKDNFVLSIIPSIIAATHKNYTHPDEDNEQESGQQCFAISEKPISIDGKVDDWAGIPPFITDEKNDVFNGELVDFKAVYLVTRLVSHAH